MAENLRLELSLSSEMGPKLSLPLVRIPPGNFQMGSRNGLPFAPEDPVHVVVISQAFSVGQFLVTQEQYATVTGNNPSQFAHNSNQPVETVTWFDAKQFCEKLSAMTGRKVRLPSEAEWEYFCRATSTTEYYFGEDSSELHEYAWFEDNSQSRPMPVGLKKPNLWGLYDIVGNVWEWCEDVWNSSYSDAPSDGSAWLKNEKQQGRRCVRGGAWNMDAFRCRSSYRSYDWNDAATDRLGFRIVFNEE